MSQKKELHIKYRPTKMSDLVGQKELVHAVEGMLKTDKIPHTLLLTGQSGGGKTTTALILATELGIKNESIQMVDCATNGGVEALRELMRGAMFRGMGLNDKKMIILDECHAISAKGQQSLLIDFENCPDHLYIVACTTDPKKLIKPLVTRCQQFNIKSVDRDSLIDLLEYVAEKEEIELGEKELSIIAGESYGSPRQALVNLSKCMYATTSDEVKALLNTVADTMEGIELCRHLAKGYSGNGFAQAIKLISKMPDVAPETVRLMVINYFARTVLGGSSNADWCIHVISNFSCSTAYNVSEKMAPVLVALFDIYDVD